MNNDECKLHSSQMGAMLTAANNRISELIKENHILQNKNIALEKEVEYWMKRYKDCEYKKHFAETTDYER